jgi:probable HAF family extracellular repeat protein
MQTRAVFFVLLAASGVMSSAAAESRTSSAGGWRVRSLGARVEISSGDGSFSVSDGDPAINNRGVVAGTLGTRVSSRAFVLFRGRVTQIGLVRGDTDSRFVDLNDRGQVVAVSYRSPGDEKNAHAILWEKGRIRNLGSFVPADINEHGDVVGTSSRGTPRALLWSRGQIHDLGRTLGGYPSEGAAINDAGQVVGRSDDDGFLWQNGKFRWLRLPPRPPYTGTVPVDINEHGQVTGIVASDTGPGGAWVWQDGKLRVINSVRDPLAINDRGQIVLNYAGDWLIWQGGKIRGRGKGEVTALNERGRLAIADDDVPRTRANGTTTRLPLLPGDQGGAATALNDREQLVGLSCTWSVEDPEAPILTYWWHCRAVLWTRPRR